MALRAAGRCVSSTEHPGWSRRSPGVCRLDGWADSVKRPSLFRQASPGDARVARGNAGWCRKTNSSLLPRHPAPRRDSVAHRGRGRGPSPRHGACAVRGLSDRWRVGARVGGGPMGGWSSSRNTVVTGAAEVCEASTGPPARRVTCHLPGALGGLVHIHGDRPSEAIVR